MKRENGKRTHFLADTFLTTFPWELAPTVVRSGGSTVVGSLSCSVVSSAPTSLGHLTLDIATCRPPESQLAGRRPRWTCTLFRSQVWNCPVLSSERLVQVTGDPSHFRDTCVSLSHSHSMSPITGGSELRGQPGC